MKKKIYIINANYYEEISDRLVGGAKIFLNENNIDHEIVNVPGALEIPTVVNLIHDKINNDNIDIGFIAIGCVIRGETTHYESVCQNSANSISKLGLKGICIGNGILNVENYDQAISRADPNLKNFGGNAAIAALTLVEISD